MLLGRDAELAALSEELIRNKATGVIGEAGVGKTALLREAAARSERATFEGGGVLTLSWRPYFALARALGDTPPEGDTAAVAAWLLDEVGEGVLIIDDVQWVDRQTRGVMGLVVGRVGMLVALRKGDPAAPRRLEELEMIGIEPFELCPLDANHAEALVRRWRPDYSEDAVRQVVKRSGGSPLFLEQLSLESPSAGTLLLSLGARLRPHARVAREAAARLALIGRPAGRRLVGEGADDLVRAGLLIEHRGRLELRHELIGQAALDEFDASDLCRLHSELASALSDPGEAARHHAKAGERELALAKALQAAQRSKEASERASHLGVAAAAARGPEANELRIQAAEALLEAADFRSALDLCTRVDLEDKPELAPHKALIQGRAHWQLGERQAANAAIADGLALANDTRTAVEVALRLEQVTFKNADWDPAVQDAEEALKLARSIGAEEARAELGLAIALLTSGAPQSIEQARRALESARREENESLELEAAAYLAAAFHNFGDPTSAHRVYVQTAERARQLGLRTREFELKHLQAHIELHTFGHLESANARQRELLHEPFALGQWLVSAHACLALGVAQTGNDREALAVLDAASPGATTGDDHAQLAWVRAEVDWLAGRPLPALDAVEECRRQHTPLDSYVTLVEGWAALDADRPASAGLKHAPYPLLAGCVPESRALEQLTRENGPKAEALFLQAARLWEGRVLFEELRCLWGASIAALQSGATDDARARLLEAERRARDRGYEPLVVRIGRSLRQAGKRRPNRRLPSKGAITARESQVLELVGSGLSTREIAIRLGVAPSTARSQVKSAMRKLGVHTRAQAALATAGSSVRPTSGRVPLVMVEDGVSLSRVGEQLQAEGWTVRPQLSLPERSWRVTGLRLVCTGVVSDQDEAARAVMVAARGAGVVAAVRADNAVRERLFEDLSRFGPVRLHHEPQDPVARLDPEHRKLLTLLASGSSLDEAAQALSYSRRTVERRLAAARAALGVRTTAEALVYVRQQRTRS